MDAAERIWLVQAPSRVAKDWRDALAHACSKRGWDFAIHERGLPLPEADPLRPLLVVAWCDDSDGLNITHRAVQLSSSQDALAALGARRDLSDHDAYYQASLRLAAAWEFAEQGAAVSWADAQEMELAGLGVVHRPTKTPVAAEEPADHPLNLFGPGPTAGSRATRWGPDVFLYPHVPAGDEVVGAFPLLGRRRLLLNGPNIFLPAGVWRFVTDFTIDPPGKTELLIEWGHGHDVASLTAPIEVPGRYEVSLLKEWSGFQPADFRISLMIPALGGDFCFHGGVLTRESG